MTNTRLAPGDEGPDFTLKNQDGDDVSLHDLRGGRVILYFYPAAMTPGCTTQACDFRDNLSSLQSAGYTVLGVSPDSPAKLSEFRERDGLTFDLLSDVDHVVLEAYAAWGEKKNYGKTYEGVIRSTVILDEDGRVEHALYNVKATGHVERIRTLIGA